MADIVLQIGLDNKELDGSLRKSIRISQDQGREAGKGFADRFNDQIKNIAIGNIIADATRGAVRLFTSEIRQGVGALRGLSAATAEVNSILGQSEKITKGVSDQFAEFSKQFGTAQQTQVKAFYNIVSGGIQGTSQRLAVLEQANKAAVAGLVDIDTAANALVSSVNAYSSSGLTAAKASDALFTAVKLGQTTFGELSGTIGQVAPIASSLGVTFDELTGAIAGITTGGIATAQAVTGLRAIFNGIVKPAESATIAAKEFGIELGENAIVAAGGFANFLEQLIQKTGGSADALSRLFTSTEALTPILSIASRGVDGFRNTLDQTRASAGSTESAFNDLKQSIDFEFKQLEAELESFRIELAQGILPAIKELIPAIKELVPIFIELAQATATFAAGVVRAGSAVAGFFAPGADQDKLTEKFVRLSSELRSTQTQLEKIEEIQQRGAINDEERFLLGQRRFLIEQRNRLEAERFVTQQRLAQTGGQAFGPEAPAELAQTNTQEISDDVLNEEKKQNPMEVATETVTALELIKSAYRSAKGEIVSDTDTAENRLKNLKQSFVDLGNTARNSFAAGVSSAFAQVGQALVEGSNAFEVFGQALIGSLGEVSKQIGQAFILQGAGFLLTNPVLGTGLIAAGAALSVFGGALSAFAGGGSKSSPAASSASASSGQFSGPSTPPISRDQEERRSDQSVQLVVQGDILDSEDSGKRLLQLLNDNFKSNNGTFVGARFA